MPLLSGARARLRSGVMIFTSPQILPIIIMSVESIGITRSDRADLLIPSADELYPTNPDLLVFVPSDNEVAFGRRQIKVIIYD